MPHLAISSLFVLADDIMNQPISLKDDDTLRAMAAAIYASVYFDDVTMSFERAERRRTREYRRSVGAAQQALAAASRVRERQKRQLPLL